MIFNNGSQTAGSEAREYSSIDIIDPPNDNGNYFLEENGTYGPTDLYWSYTSQNPYDFYADHISGSSRLENGNTIICSGPQGHFFEINPLGNIVWEYINPITSSGILSQGDTATDGQNPVFNCKRYTHNYPAFENKDLTPNGYIELNSIDYMCETYNNIELNENLNFSKKKLIKKIDILGRETNNTKNLILYIYDDGTVSKKIQIEN